MMCHAMPYKDKNRFYYKIVCRLWKYIVYLRWKSMLALNNRYGRFVNNCKQENNLKLIYKQ